MSVAGVGLRFAERLEGSVRLGASPTERPMRLTLRGIASAIEFFAGAPVVLTGEIVAPSLGLDTEVRGRLRFLRASRELDYTIEAAGAEQTTELIGKKRGLLSDPYAGLTTLPLVVRRGGAVHGHALLRFDARSGLFAGIPRLTFAWA
ncbi:MAG: hypothetical protein HOV80_19550 [Polyangiaceae bacterium]|nr:hypothetical protein [Polyangiaceae bacterium]